MGQLTQLGDLANCLKAKQEQKQQKNKTYTNKNPT